MICGAAFILFTSGTSSLLSFRAWDGEDNLLSNISEISNGLSGGALVGLFVGLFAKRNLQRNVS
jgi:hypothetical protein